MHKLVADTYIERCIHNKSAGGGGTLDEDLAQEKPEYRSEPVGTIITLIITDNQKINIAKRLRVAYPWESNCGARANGSIRFHLENNWAARANGWL